MMTTGPAESAPSRTTAIVLSAAFSLALHGSVLAAAFVWLDSAPGAVPAPTDAISIELFQTEVVEAVAPAPSLASAASPASVAVEAGAQRDVAPAATASEIAKPAPPVEVAAVEPPASETAREIPKGLEVLKGAAETTDAVGKDEERPAPAKEIERPRKQREPERREKDRPQKTAKLTDPDATDKSDAKASKKGGAPSKANTGSAATKARVSGSTGSAVNYAAIVRARVAARKPGGGGRRGTVVISFGVTSSGGLGYASVARSSGDPGLDRSVLSAVRGASFPAPPPGAGTRFAVPFYFR
jgi:periplasmic protein TonB